MTDVDLIVLYPLAIAVPFVAALLLTPLAGRLARRLDVVDRPSAHKYHRVETPYLGGLAVAVATVLVAGLTSGTSAQLVTILVSGLALSLVGLLDDQRLVAWWLKLVVEVVAACALWIVGVRAGLFGVEALDLLLTILWVVAVTNAVNMLDNMDGLAPGVAAISALTFFVVAADQGDFLVASFALAVCGASLGFLRWNFPPARIFLGDAGTLLLGFSLAAIGLKLDLVGPSGFVRSAIPILAIGVPLLDAVLVIIDRARGRRPVYQGGTDHSSHRLAGRGMSGRRVALLTYAAQLLASALALAVLYLPWGGAVTIVVVASVAAIAALLILLELPQRPRKPTDVRLAPSRQPAPR